MGATQPDDGVLRDPDVDRLLSAGKPLGDPMAMARMIPACQWSVEVTSAEGVERMPVEVATFNYLQMIATQLAEIIGILRNGPDFEG